MHWSLKRFQQLTVDELYRIIRLRIDIFVVEQNCPYPELDGKDMHPEALHLFSTINNEVAAYMRIFPPGVSYPNQTSLGRVVTNEVFRRQGLGRQLLSKAVEILDQRWPDKVCHISAQAYLQDYYAKQHFIAEGEGYLEDDIPHIAMLRQPLAGDSKAKLD